MLLFIPRFFERIVGGRARDRDRARGGARWKKYCLQYAMRETTNLLFLLGSIFILFIAAPL